MTDPYAVKQRDPRHNRFLGNEADEYTTWHPEWRIWSERQKPPRLPDDERLMHDERSIFER